MHGLSRDAVGKLIGKITQITGVPIVHVGRAGLFGGVTTELVATLDVSGFKAV